MQTQRNGRPKFQLAATIFTAVLWCALIGFAIAYRDPIGKFLERLKLDLLPCQQPITYSLGTFDTRFGISQETFLKAIAQAEQIWETPAKKQLFAFAKDGALKINLIYDARQAATVRLQQLGIAVRDDEAGYNALKAKYDAMQASTAQQKAAYEKSVTDFDAKRSAYEAEVAAANRRGGATPEEYNRLEQERAALNAEADALNRQRDALNAAVDTLNSMVTVLNRLAAALNKTAVSYNTTNATQGTEFEEGVYKSDAMGSEIDIYQFDNTQKLVRVLAHELGHALGLDHVDDPAAIMYRLNQSKNEKLTAADLSELKKRCALP